MTNYTAPIQIDSSFLFDPIKTTYLWNPEEPIILKPELDYENTLALLHAMTYEYWAANGGEEDKLLESNLEQFRFKIESMLFDLVEG